MTTLKMLFDRRKSISGGKRSAATVARRSGYYFAEKLESRAMMATFAVTSNIDSGPGVYTPGELRWAINEANLSAGTDEIVFQLPANATTISLVGGLDSIIEQVLIDGTTQPGYLTAPIVAIDGSAVVDVGIRITASASGSTIKALSLFGFQYDSLVPDSGNAVVIDGSADSNEITACFIGTDASSAVGIGNAAAGVLVRGSNTTIRNSVISGNGASGVILENDENTVLVGNRIGTDHSGGLSLPNAAHGVLLRDSLNPQIGGSIAADRNVISGNAADGIRADGAFGAVILGNYIGVDAATGAVAVANGGSGVSLFATQTTIGDGTAGGRNVISGNEGDGVLVRAGDQTRIAGNYIGVAATGTVRAGNVLDGIRIDGGVGHVIGGIAAGEGNVIGDNGGHGIQVTGEASDVLVQQNLVGLGITLAALGNGGDGILLLEASSVTVTYRNRIAFNSGAGVRLTAASGNSIGADASRDPDVQGLGFGNAVYANGGDGVRLEAESNDNVVAANLVGLATPNGAIQGNGGDGIAVQASRRNTIGGVLGTLAFSNIVVGNSVGVSLTNCDALDYFGNGGDGNLVLGNEVRNNVGHGIVVDDAAFQMIGGLQRLDSNTITLNGGNGIEIRNGSRSITAAGNYVGTNAAGVLGFGNGGVGVRVLQSNASVIGGDAVSDAGNLVIGNGSDGISITRVDDSGVTAGDARENRVFGNEIRANRASGIRITSASDNLIGDEQAGFGNTVGNNALDGLRIEEGADGNAAFGNTLGGAAGLGNGGVGVRITASYENVIGKVDGGNSISRNLGGGIVIDRSRAVDLGNGNVIVGNTIDANLGSGIHLLGSSFQVIGGPLEEAGAGNVVTRNRGVGIRLASDTTADANTSDENMIRSNFVGTNSAGDALGNTSHGAAIIRGSFNVLQGNTIGRNLGVGIRVDGGLSDTTVAQAADNVIGGSGDGEGNTIVANGRGGILLENDTRRNSIIGGVVDSNVGVGIDVRGSQDTQISGGVSVVKSTTDGILVTSQRVGGITVASAGTLISDAFVGTDAGDTAGLGNQSNGIRLSGVAGVTVGAGVVSAFNRLAGVRIENSTAASLADGNVVQGAELRNNANGIVVSASSYQSIGGVTDGFGNLTQANTTDGIAIADLSRFISVRGNTVAANGRHGISLASTNDSTISDVNVVMSNGFDGINVSSTSVRNLIAGNVIGDELDPASGNARDGIGLHAVNNNTVSNNLIAGNVRHGLMVSGAVAGGAVTTNSVKSNRIVANGQNGVTVLGSRNQVIGGTAVDEENTIGLNKADGIHIGQLSSAVIVLGNLIGTDLAGGDIGNFGDGVEINNATAAVIEANELRFNDGNGIRVSGVRGTAAQQTLVRSNAILGNDLNGILISASTGTLVGGPTKGNMIGENARAGIRIGAAASGNMIQANTIGTDSLGTDLGNAEDGVLITGSLGNVVSGGNTVSFNNVGVRIFDAVSVNLAAGNRIEANLVSENDTDGIVVLGGAFHTIGGEGLGNTVTLNGGDGVLLKTSGRNTPIGNLVRGNLIGTDASQAAFANLGNGVRIVGGGSNVVDQNAITDNVLAGVVVAASSSNVIGSTVVGKANRIIRNGSGVEITDVLDEASGATATTRGNVVTGNAIRFSAGNGVTVSGARTVATILGMTSGANAMTGQGNAIRDNAGVGIALQNAAQQVSIQGNSIFDNVGGAISRAAGTNVGAATPTVTSVQFLTPSRSVAQLAVRGSLSGVAANQQYQLDVYSSRPEDGNGSDYGARVYLGRATVTARASGTLQYSIQVPAGVSQLGDFVTVIATNLRPPAFTSSEFSAGRAIVLASPSVTAAGSPTTSASAASGTNSTSSRSRVVR